MRIVCIYTKEITKSIIIAKRCVDSAKKFGYNVELFPSINWKNLKKIHKELNIISKYIPTYNTNVHTLTTCPAVRIANGTTHYILYKWAVQNDEPICILEHDAKFVNKLPQPIIDGVIQISSHINKQSNEKTWKNCTRAKKMKQYQPTFKFSWNNITNGIIKHPLTGTNGTSGYIIHQNAAKKMVNYIKHDGIANADRIRTEWIGKDNLYLQIPQSIICDHIIRSAGLKL